MLARVRIQQPATAVLTALVLLAWLALWGWGASPYGRLLNHQYVDQVQADRSLLLVYLAGWVLMLVAMMLPTSLPLLLTFDALVRHRTDHRRLMTLLVVGYLSVWTLFGLVVHAGDAFVHVAVAQVPWLQAHAWAIGAGTLVLAGVYQFVPLKYLCLDRCRSPLLFITSRWRGRQPRGDAFRLGVQHGVFCIGCCWSLMLLMFAVGVGSLGWMLALGAIMGVEKNLAWGRRLSAPLGVFLIGWAAVVALVPSWL